MVRSDYNYPVVEIESGKIRGLEFNGQLRFLAIPYAKAKRFHMPELADPWTGIKDACCYGYAPFELETKIASDELLVPHYYARQGEECLDINIWTPSISKEKKRPVIVWLHGGGWKMGSSVEQFAYEGANMASRGDLIFVTFNNRQNCLGNLDLSSVDESYEHSVFLGLEDVLAALRWVQRNISVFGGDPDNVTIVGQAGGGKRLLSIMQCPSADGLYHKAALGSCAGECMNVPQGWSRKDVASRMGELVVQSLGLTGGRIKEIERIPFYKLSEAVNRAEKLLKREVPGRFRWEPIADGHFMTGNPFLEGFRDETLKIPMLVGSSLGEMMGNFRVIIGDGRKNKWNDEQVRCYAKDMFDNRGEDILSAFSMAYQDHCCADALFTDRVMRPMLNRLSRERAAKGGKLWNWIFALESPIRDGIVAWHCAETPYITGNMSRSPASIVPEVGEAMEDIMLSAWSDFAWTGNPNRVGRVYWPQVGEEQLPTMIFDRQIRVGIDHDQLLMELYEK